MLRKTPYRPMVQEVISRFIDEAQPAFGRGSASEVPERTILTFNKRKVPCVS